MTQFKKITGTIAILLVIIIGVVVVLNYPKLDIITGFSAKNMCSSVFVAGRTVEFTDMNDNSFEPIRLADDSINKNEKSATATVFGLRKRKARYRDGLGSVLIPPDTDFDPVDVIPSRNKIKKHLPYPYGDLPQKDTVFTNIDIQILDKAVTSAFSQNNSALTRSVIVVYKDQIIAERYAEGYNASSILLGWSMTKSILATLFGILEYQGKIDLNQPAGVEQWQMDERKNITINHLLHMNSGLEWDEDYSSISDVNKMLFLAADMSTAQIEKEFAYKPDEHWNYSSGTTNLLSRILRNQFTSQQEYLDFMYEALVDRIGMNSMLIETDMSGHFVGSSYGWGTTRDWAKFGLLYMHQGDWNGDQLFGKKWVDYVSTPAPNSDGKYGGHFWLNTENVFLDAPMDLYSANGFQGQRVFVIPSKELVIVRFGLQELDFNQFLSDVVNAVE